MMAKDLKEVGTFFKHMSTRKDVAAIVVGHGTVVVGVDNCAKAFAHLATQLGAQ